ncbi:MULTISPECIES: monovalent cation/H(+) antiporter subunit G [unclassified Meridianimarinicoccus]|uniref:monovalent cation/H(+) antiporter subunit G n=1 Tax=unclassified Meridianimarinicoccus TaxID=2923344 RepID=UPI00186687FE|nr:monovalent cation/H(+) antiporter subunit G [Fluviibacterium sp. MJW13]
MTEIIAGILVLTGGAFAFIAGLGVLKLPDVLNRMHASTKAGTLGSALTLAAAALHFEIASVTTKAVATILFLMLTAPIAAHMIGRATVEIRRVKAARAAAQAKRASS